MFMNDNAKKIGLGVAAAVLCALAFYFMYWIKTPAYSVNIIRESIAKHDVVNFEKHVDMDTLYSKAIDDIIIAQDRIEHTNISSNPFLMGILQIMKPAIINEMKINTIENVKGVDESAGGKKSEASKMAESMQKKADVKNMQLNDISVVSKANGEAMVAVKVYSKKVAKDFTFKIKMHELSDGTWQVKEITNLAEILVEMDAAEKALKAGERNAA